MSLNRRMAKGVAWMVALRLFVRGIGLISTIILARLLMPTDFGLVAMATALMGLVVMFSELGVETVLVQKTTIDRADLDSAWSLQIVFALGQALILVALASLTADFYDEPRLEMIIYALALAITIGGLKNIGVVEFRRELIFSKEFQLTGGRKITAFMVTVTVAFFFHSYWALVIGIVTGELVLVLLSYFMHSYRPRFGTERWGEIFRFSKWLVLNNMLHFIWQKAPVFALGKLDTVKSVGMLSMAYDIAMLPTTEMVSPINRAVFPGYSRMKDDISRMSQGHLDVSGMIALVVIPASVGILASAGLLIPVLLGDQWLETIPLVKVIALAGGITAMHWNTGPIFLAMGRPHVVTMLNMISTLVLVPSLIVLGMGSGVLGITYALLLTAIVSAIVTIAFVLHELRTPFVRYLQAVYRPIAGTMVMYGFLTALVIPSLNPMEDLSSGAKALIVIVAGALSYGVLVLFFWYLAGLPRGAEKFVIQLLSEKLQAQRAG